MLIRVAPTHAALLLCVLLVQEAGYDESAQLLIEDVMMSKNVPDPRDIRKYDLIGVFGMINYRTLRVSRAQLAGWQCFSWLHQP